MYRLQQCFVILMYCFVGGIGFVVPHEGIYKLDIVHFNDFHARFEETSVETSSCRFNNASCLGGFSRLYHEIMELKARKPDCLVLNAGDSFQGTYWYTLLKWNVTQEFMNMIPHDAHALGNHEFDDGPEGLVPYLNHLKAPVVAANMDSTNEPTLQGLYKRHIIVDRRGRKIGIIGLITVDTATLSSAGKVKFTDPIETTRREAQILTDKGVDIIIVLSHCGLDVDKKLAREVGEHVDIIVGGHSHSLLWNGPSPSQEVVDGPYPVFIESTADKLHKVLIVQASAFTKYMGDLSVYFDYRGNYRSWEGGPIYLNRSIPQDIEINEKLESYSEVVRNAENVKVGESASLLNFEDCVYGECALGDLMVDCFNELAKTKVSSILDYISVLQRGDIKSSINKGTITQGQIFDLLPYNDRLYSFQLRGDYVLEALQRSVTDAWQMNPFKGPWVLQVSGLKVIYNMLLPEGSRLTSALVMSSGNTKPVDPKAYYQVTVPSYLAEGGDGFQMFKNGRNTTIIGRDQAVLLSCIKERSPINISTDNRIVLVKNTS